MSDVKRLSHRQTQLAAQQLRHLVLDPGVERKAPLVRCDCDKEGRQSQLLPGCAFGLIKCGRGPDRDRSVKKTYGRER